MTDSSTMRVMDRALTTNDSATSSPNSRFEIELTPLSILLVSTLTIVDSSSQSLFVKQAIGQSTDR